MASVIGATLAIILALLVSVCEAGEYCYTGSLYTNYCLYGCCGIGNTECCSSSIGLIVGLCVGGAVFLFFIILTLCMCRRRHYGGFIYRSQPAVVVQQGNVTTQQGVVGTAGVQPGIVYPPYQQYPYHGAAYPAGPTAPPPYPAAAYQPGYPPQPYSAEPPKYETLNYGADGGITNRGFEDKN
ncbi:unnamed protein product [Candidula unifasciata]|uniref:Cysteine and tyrosine-rich protein 1 n=1 Tax=Candidula unifasciata TaxID=100452 RepID=A0A8S3ZSX5_9EUPU|nr:unnamed protein product [Candidula unifasciata]